jgi:hypothetical protein
MKIATVNAAVATGRRTEARFGPAIRMKLRFDLDRSPNATIPNNDIGFAGGPPLDRPMLLAGKGSGPIVVQHQKAYAHESVARPKTHRPQLVGNPQVLRLPAGRNGALRLLAQPRTILESCDRTLGNMHARPTRLAASVRDRLRFRLGS